MLSCDLVSVPRSPALLSPITLPGQRSSKRQKMAEDTIIPPSKIDFGADPDPGMPSPVLTQNLVWKLHTRDLASFRPLSIFPAFKILLRVKNSFLFCS